MKTTTAVLAAVLALAGGLGGCETATPYQPLEKGSAVSGGFTDQRLDADHFRVTFRGNALTSRETVETYLLYRAAELTLAQGFDWFETADRHTARDKRTYVDPDPFYGPGYAWGYWRPDWRYFGGGFGWRGWGPFWGDPFWASGVQVQTVQKFEASAEIFMGHGPKPEAAARVFDARAVVANLGATIQRPAPKS
ncbi:MAG: CC0125/CC1285 family lipoprotein [Caulobacteraceae bacterium]